MSQGWRRYNLIFFLQVLQEDRDPMKRKKHDKLKLSLVEDLPELDQRFLNTRPSLNQREKRL